MGLTAWKVSKKFKRFRMLKEEGFKKENVLLKGLSSLDLSCWLKTNKFGALC